MIIYLNFFKGLLKVDAQINEDKLSNPQKLENYQQAQKFISYFIFQNEPTYDSLTLDKTIS